MTNKYFICGANVEAIGNTTKLFLNLDQEKIKKLEDGLNFIKTHMESITEKPEESIIWKLASNALNQD